MPTFTVTAERGAGDVWVLECAEVGAVSQTRRLDQVADEMREAIAYLAQLDESEVDIVVEPIVNPAIAELKERADYLYRQSDEIRAEAIQTRQAVVAALKEQGYTVRDMGIILDVSYQRAAQLAASL
ncbi:MAG: hypothetical protein Q4D85_13025 [Corynebacterium sp.]|uniref:hypothetical protein n=1 Tax=Corynebacterium sp. TaxID=1720 RepID=UPI0026DCA8ED|nr:hypothetical protein [Corynebacterium sp.]MDO5099656.1 hypothetical protein [Corynebacterium sp.]